MDFLHFDLISMIQTVGYVGLFVMVFGESGFFLFFLPGDSLLFTAGILASQGIFNIWTLLVLFALAAILGDSAGYWVGKKAGDWLLRQKDTFFFKKSHIHKAQAFYDEHGGKTLILARFIPAVRTFVPVVAGMANMEYNKFLSFNIIGGLIWGVGLTVLGYALGSQIKDVEHYLLPIIAIIVMISFLPAVFHMRGDIARMMKKNPVTKKLMQLKEKWIGDTPL